MESEYFTVSNSPWILRMTFDKEKMHELDIMMRDVYCTLVEFYGKKIRIYHNDDNTPQKAVMRIVLVYDGPDMVTELKALEHNIMENVVVKGVTGINKVSIDMSKRNEFLSYNKEREVFDTVVQYVMDTDGSNLFEVLSHPNVDSTRTISNDIIEIYELLGIEAAREALMREILSVLDSLHVDYHHLSLLVDTMTMKGNLLSIDRHGINRSDIGPLAKCSFEETSDMLVKAGVFAEYDKINGVSANIMLGQIPPCGTGDSIISMDLNLLPEKPANYMDAGPGMISKCDISSMNFDFDLPEPGQHSDMFMPM
jgi:DNA-directed RNA polymerase II subunit RPB1